MTPTLKQGSIIEALMAWLPSVPDADYLRIMRESRASANALKSSGRIMPDLDPSLPEKARKKTG